MRIARRRIERCAAVPLSRDPGEYGLQLTQELQCVRMHHGWLAAVARKRRTDVSTRVIHQDPGGAGLRASHVPRVLITRIGKA